MKRRLIVAMTGASGIQYGVRMLEALAEVSGIETHLVMSAASFTALPHEYPANAAAITRMADVVHKERDIAASISSGSFRTDGMIIIPCTIKTLSAVANCYSDTLIHRAADVVLKERRRLVLVVRETPLHAGHLQLMMTATASGAIIYPPVPAMYAGPQSVQDVIDHTVVRILDLFDIATDIPVRRWTDPDVE